MEMQDRENAEKDFLFRTWDIDVGSLIINIIPGNRR